MKFLFTLGALAAAWLCCCSSRSTTRPSRKQPNGLLKFSYPNEEKVDWYPQTPTKKHLLALNGLQRLKGSGDCQVPVWESAGEASDMVGLTREEMKECQWLRPQIVAQSEFREWTPDGHLRH